MKNNKPALLRANDFLKSILKGNCVGEFMYRRILQPVWRMYRIPKTRKLMDMHGYEVMGRLHSVFGKYDIPYYCDAGTLLGFIRDGGFIKGDADIDVSVMPDYGALSNALKILLDEGYRFVYAYKFQDRLLEFTVMDSQVELTIDVFQSEYCDSAHRKLLVRYLRWFEGRAYPTDADNTALEFRFAAPTAIRTLVVHGVTVAVPENAEQILDDEYGPWRIPDPSFKSDMIPHGESPHFARRVDMAEALNLM